MIRIHFYLPEPTIAKLTEKAKTAGVPLSELVRRAIDEFLSKRK